MHPHQSKVVKSAFHEGLALARALFDDGKYREAIEEADKILSSNVSESIRVKALLTKGASFGELGQAAECVRVLAEASPLIDRVEPRARASFYGQRAISYRKINRLDEAFIDFEASLVCAEEAGDLEIQARTHNNLGNLYSQIGRYDEASREVDAAIRVAQQIGDTLLEGRFYETKANVYLNQTAYENALISSIRAINLLGSHPSAAEARETHARALRAVSDVYLAEPDPVETFRLRRVIVNGLTVKLDSEIVHMALKRSDGQVAKAAKLLNVKHPSLIEFVEKHRLKRRPKGHSRAKSLIKT